MKVGESYKIVVSVQEKLLTYTGKIISNDESFITFIDRYGKEYSYNKLNIISFEEIKWERKEK